MVCSLIREFCDISTIHGLRYLAASNTSLLGRLFWFAACCAAFYGTAELLSETLHLHEGHSVSFTVDTTYLNWNTRFPAVSVCEMESSDKIYDRARTMYGEEHDMDLDLFVRDIAFFSGTCYTCSSHCKDNILKCPTDIKNIATQVRSSCQELLAGCHWNGQEFPCCAWFRPLHTELGLCYTINSLLAPNKTAYEKLSCNKHTGPGILQFYALENVKVYIHAPESVPYLNQPLDEQDVIYWGTNFEMSLGIRHINNDPALSSVKPAYRGCILQEENFLIGHSHYSYSACVVECRARAQIEKCNCTHHLLPDSIGNKTCDIPGLECLTQFSEELRSVKTSWYAGKAGLVCECPAACTEPELSVVWKQSSTNLEMLEESSGSRIKVQLDALPTERFQRTVVRSKLDLVVSMGGAAGLFLGASLLSFVELIYFYVTKFIYIFINKIHK